MDAVHEEIPLPMPSPSVLISICRLWGKEYPNETTNVKPIAHFSHHAFLIRFDGISSYEMANMFELIYERLIIPLPQRNFFEYDAEIFKKDFLRSRYNLDELIMHQSEGAYHFFVYNDDQFPISIQKHQEKFKAKNISDLEMKYYINSGYHHNCIHDSWYHKLQALTHGFNAYDRIFCDTFERHGLQRSFTPYWNVLDMYWFRGRLLRDELLSTFPPDASNVVFYASPKLTFVVLQKDPETWQFVVRPFNKSLWMFLIVYCTIFEVIRHLNIALEWIYEQIIKLKMKSKKIFSMILYEDRGKLKDMAERHKWTIETFHALLRITVTSAYGGMILVGILNPRYPWTPETFAELNHTRNYYVCTAKSSPDGMIEHLNESGKLNGVDKSMIMKRIHETPVDYLVKELKKEEEEKDKYYAAVMYDDKMNLWLKGRQHIWQTVPFFKKLKPASDKILPEMRYVSVSAGATRLHFLIDTLKRVFTSGTWMRWYYLEQNYYKNVVPIIVDRILLKDLNSEKMKDDDERRPLTIYDLFSLFAIKGFGSFLAFTIYVLESWYAERCLMGFYNID
ncbi:unnamed protein product [Orchesella dallaii]|uniref:Uncharacterized protein n=1 Tax=Orchesella dallaii TaxID=48710 RepID=A0ABP1QIF4_9HEXA